MGLSGSKRCFSSACEYVRVEPELLARLDDAVLQERLQDGWPLRFRDACDSLLGRSDGEVEGIVALEREQPLERQLVPAAGVLEELDLNCLDRHPVDVSQPLDRVQDPLRVARREELDPHTLARLPLVELVEDIDEVDDRLLRPLERRFRFAIPLKPLAQDLREVLARHAGVSGGVRERLQIGEPELPVDLELEEDDLSLLVDREDVETILVFGEFCKL